tara:strand:+ start:1879 stop:2163 length:285 start_codon:yes stop_codon:yes gene_type:complete
MATRRIRNIIRAARDDTSLADSFLDEFANTLLNNLGVSGADIDQVICVVCGKNQNFASVFNKCRRCNEDEEERWKVPDTQPHPRDYGVRSKLGI